jgi:amidase
MSIGADQGGSIRLPAANSGLVGLKPTWGLVPYTGVISLDATIDHVGPMTRTVSDCATLLQVIAGTDGIDDRQPPNMPPSSIKYGMEIARHLEIKHLPLKGLKIGILEEGFNDPLTSPSVASTCRTAIARFTSLGATVSTVSIPLHSTAGLLWMVALPMAGLQQGLLSFPTGRKQLLFPERAEMIGERMSQEAFDELGWGAQNVYLRGLFLKEHFGAPLQARCTNLIRKLSEAYDRALGVGTSPSHGQGERMEEQEGVDLLVMPTIIYPPKKLRTADQMPGGKSEMGPLEMLSRTVGATQNTCPFNSSGHPALSLPVGFVPAEEDEKVMLPTGLQIVGRKWEDLLVLKVAASWEKANDWKTFRA